MVLTHIFDYCVLPPPRESFIISSFCLHSFRMALLPTSSLSVSSSESAYVSPLSLMDIFAGYASPGWQFSFIPGRTLCHFFGFLWRNPLSFKKTNKNVFPLQGKRCQSLTGFHILFSVSDFQNPDCDGPGIGFLWIHHICNHGFFVSHLGSFQLLFLHHFFSPVLLYFWAPVTHVSPSAYAHSSPRPRVLLLLFFCPRGSFRVISIVPSSRPLTLSSVLLFCCRVHPLVCVTVFFRPKFPPGSSSYLLFLC